MQKVFGNIPLLHLMASVFSSHNRIKVSCDAECVLAANWSTAQLRQASSFAQLQAAVEGSPSATRGLQP